MDHQTYPRIEPAPRYVRINGQLCYRVGSSPGGTEWIAYRLEDWDRMAAMLRIHWARAEQRAQAA